MFVNTSYMHMNMIKKMGACAVKSFKYMQASCSYVLEIDCFNNLNNPPVNIVRKTRWSGGSNYSTEELHSTAGMPVFLMLKLKRTCTHNHTNEC